MLATHSNSSYSHSHSRSSHSHHHHHSYHLGSPSDSQRHSSSGSGSSSRSVDPSTPRSPALGASSSNRRLSTGPSQLSSSVSSLSGNDQQEYTHLPAQRRSSFASSRSASLETNGSRLARSASFSRSSSGLASPPLSNLNSMSHPSINLPSTSRLHQPSSAFDDSPSAAFSPTAGSAESSSAGSFSTNSSTDDGHGDRDGDADPETAGVVSMKNSHQGSFDGPSPITSGVPSPGSGSGSGSAMVGSMEGRLGREEISSARKHHGRRPSSHSSSELPLRKILRTEMDGEGEAKDGDGEDDASYIDGEREDVEMEGEATESQPERDSERSPDDARQTSSGPPQDPSGSSSAPARASSTNPASVQPPTSSTSTSRSSPPVPPPRAETHVDLATYPSQDLLRLLASLLEQIAKANDELRPAEGLQSASYSHSHNQAHAQPAPPVDGGASAAALSPSTQPQQQQAPGRTNSSSSGHQIRHPALMTASMASLTSPSASLCFHARNIPSISIEAYLLRILRYCPTTNEVFLSLLVYFDRMAKIGAEVEEETARSDSVAAGGAGGANVPPGTERRPFAIDSYNVHRLVIAGVTVASKFFSDVFYTNSRYAKVGGLPLSELNQLEVQFLLLNDFRLTIPVEEMQRYADQLLVHWAAGTNGPASVPAPSSVASPPASTADAMDVDQAAVEQATASAIPVTLPSELNAQPPDDPVQSAATAFFNAARGRHHGHSHSQSYSHSHHGGLAKNFAEATSAASARGRRQRVNFQQPTGLGARPLRPPASPANARSQSYSNAHPSSHSHSRSFSATGRDSSRGVASGSQDRSPGARPNSSSATGVDAGRSVSSSAAPEPGHGSFGAMSRSRPSFGYAHSASSSSATNSTVTPGSEATVRDEGESEMEGSQAGDGAEDDGSGRRSPWEVVGDARENRGEGEDEVMKAPTPGASGTS